MKIIHIHSLIALTILIHILPINSFSESNENKNSSSNVIIQDAQDTKPSSAVSPVEVQIKDNKTQQTSTLIVNPNERLFKELQEMKISIQQIQQTLDYLVNHVIADLEAENQQLKMTLQNYGLNPFPQDNTHNSTPKYIPGNPTTRTPLPSFPTTDTLSKKDKPITGPQEFYFRILEEWGRNPDIVKQLNANAPSIKGIIGVVPYGSSREKLQELARELRVKYDEYDNINIEVFDDETSAKEYIEKNIKSQEHNVLSISKHKDSGRDIITIYGINESSQPIPEQTSPIEN